MRKAILSIGLATLIALTAGAYAEKEEFEWSGGAGAKTFIVNNVDGDIKVAGGGDTIVIKATKISDDPVDLGEVDIVVSEVGSTVEVTAEYPERYFEELNVEVKFDIKIPENVKLQAYVVSGDVTVSDVASVNAESTSGNVNVSKAHEYVKVSSVNGTITVDNEDQPTERLKASTVNGNIDLNLSLPESEGDYEISSVSGDISVNLFGEVTNYVAGIESISGAVETDLPLKDESGIVETVYEGTAGAGTNRVDISTISGSIKLNTQ
ncbi:MAG: DUF4097 family beta strand repeat protein [Candidatus Coatesbacteria bacterium]|nr:MAG: DUF4097 family beta strand repeat protein [Candidatus Coatesbacteria bacterium]